MKIGYFSPLIFLTLFGSCKDDKESAVLFGSQECRSDEKMVKSVNNQNGIIFYHAGEEKYGISYGITGTYDSVDVGFLCEIPDSLQQTGLQVVFSGNLFSFDKKPPAILAGQTYYYLDVTDLKLR
ncbi:hypothetical protein [Dyadobacter sp. CY312]|uniref:hypothetical protein n=1 Tax=Dyadobacter sp. CY312 TaxID=2907303 RepID=UPI001F28B4B1|nr:hypothetical protein [Dyadobacter sp. CY312]MCE7042057.1 hypothetical protein [Dyadobacter sp. CY312]